jgi:hypothetical protein
MTKKLIHQTTGLGFPLQLFKTGKNSYTVVYGQQKTAWLDYIGAAHEYGECLMHALQLAGKLD